MCEVPQPPQFGGNRTREIVVVKPQLPEPGQVGQFFRYGARQTVSVEPQLPEPVQIAQLDGMLPVRWLLLRERCVRLFNWASSTGIAPVRSLSYSHSLPK